MCGLISIISNKKETLSTDAIGTFKELLYVGALRGFDSTGMLTIPIIAEEEVIKKAAAAGSFLYNLQQKKQYIFGRALIGHNRAATKGAIIDENAHPFIAGNIILAHNGTLFSHRHLADVTVDSNAIAIAINEKGIKEILPKLEGAFALIWYDKKEKKIYAIRNKERPLFLIRTKTLTCLVSEKEMGRWVLSRNGYKVLETEQIQENILYTLDLNTPELKISRENLSKLITKKSTSITVWKSETTQKPEHPKQEQQIQADKKKFFNNGLIYVGATGLKGWVYDTVNPAAPGGYYKNIGLFTDFSEIEFICYSPEKLENSEVEFDIINIIDRAGKIEIYCKQSEYIAKTKEGNSVPKEFLDKFVKCSFCKEETFINNYTAPHITIKPKFTSITKIDPKTEIKYTIQEPNGYLIYCKKCTDFMEKTKNKKSA